MGIASTRHQRLVRQNLALAKARNPELRKQQLSMLRDLTCSLCLSIAKNELLYLDGKWYVTHSGLMRLATRNHCRGINVQIVREFCEAVSRRWAFKATVYKSRTCRGFVGYGDADPSNVSPLVHGAELRVAETRAVNRALRKAYGIGICSVEEISSLSEKAPQPSNGNNENFAGRTLRDRLCQLIRQHQLDAPSVKSYATEFCGVKTLRDATREQVERFVAHLAELAEKDRTSLICQLNSYSNSKVGAA